MKHHSVDVVVLSYNRKSLLADCLDSLTNQTYRDFRVCVVDNASSDGTAEMVRERYPDVTLLALPDNRGFAGGVSEAVARTEGETIALLNNDAIAEPDWLSELVDCLLRHPRAAACTSAILMHGPHGELVLDSAGNGYSLWGVPYPIGRGAPLDTQPDERSVFAVSGGACLIRRSVVEHVGLFDEKFFIYHEDVDFSFRARLAGYDIVYCPRAKVVHTVGATSGGAYTAKTRYHSAKNICLVYIKNLPGRMAVKRLPGFLLAQLLSLINALSRRVLRAHVSGLLEVALLLPHALSERKRILASADRRSIDAVEALMGPRLPPSHSDRLRLPFMLRRSRSKSS